MHERFSKEDEKQIEKVLASVRKEGKIPSEVKFYSTTMKTLGLPLLIFDKKAQKQIKLWDEVERRLKEVV